MRKILILDLGGQYGQLTTRRVRDCQVFAEVRLAANMTVEAIRETDPVGIILVGSGDGCCGLDPRILCMGVPVLGIGSGCTAMIRAVGGKVTSGCRIYGRTVIDLKEDAVLFSGMPTMTIGWMDHSEKIEALPEGFVTTATTDCGATVAFSCQERQLYGTVFHPEAGHTEGGQRMLERFLKEICGAEEEWTMENVLAMAVEDARQRIGDRKVLLALSGGVDSSVVAALLSRAVGRQLTCIFVDHGMLRLNEGDEVEAFFSRVDTHFVRVNAAERFQSRLSGITDPDEKRRIIGEEFVRVFEEEARKLGGADFLAQGTIYPDILETGTGYADVIKSHRDMGGLPEHIDFKELIEPLRMLFKEEVRSLGRTMGLPEFLVDRQPFPGPGLAIRTVGQITPEKLDTLRRADRIFATELEKAHMHRHIGQYFAVLTDTQLYQSIDGRSAQGYVLALRAVTTDDFMTAKWARLPYELLDKISAQILKEIPAILRVVYDISSKPPATIEWE